MARFTAGNETLARSIIARYPRPKSALIPLLHLCLSRSLARVCAHAFSPFSVSTHSSLSLFRACLSPLFPLSWLVGHAACPSPSLRIQPQTENGFYTALL